MVVTSTSITLSEVVMSENLSSSLEAIVRSTSDALSCVRMVFETYVRTLIYGYACGSSCCSSIAGDEVKGFSSTPVVLVFFEFFPLSFSCSTSLSYVIVSMRKQLASFVAALVGALLDSLSCSSTTAKSIVFASSLVGRISTNLVVAMLVGLLYDSLCCCYEP